ncbi:MAG: mechanosensitive ion channel [Lachnospiraceae bacterium]|nr:mechanosensitive ion channel [Lachnospiraceae bacterium]
MEPGYTFFDYIPKVIWAVILLIIAWVVASVCRSIVKKMLKKFFDKNQKNTPLEVQAKSMGTVDLVGNLVFAVIFFLFLPGALEQLGMYSVIEPISATIGQFLNFIPNIVACIILIAFGSFLSKLVAQIVNTLLKKTKLDSLQEKAHINPGEGMSFSDIISKLVYAMILVVFVIAGIQVLGIAAISEPATAMVGQIFAFVPALFAAIILIAFGIFLGRLTGGIVQSILAGTGIDKFSKDTYQNGSENAAPASKIISNVVTVVIDIVFVVAGVKVLGIEVLTDVGNMVIGYMPSVLAACLILLAAWAASLWVQKAIIKVYPGAASVAFGARVVIVVLASFMAINQLGISQDIIKVLFTCICVAAGAAFAIAFGVGGKDWAKKKLDDISKNTEDQFKEKNDQK